MDTPICLDDPICLEDVLMPAVHIQHKESMLYQTEGGPYAPIHLDAPICLDATVCLNTPYSLDVLIPLDATVHVALSKHTVGQPNIWRGIQTYDGI